MKRFVSILTSVTTVVMTMGLPFGALTAQAVGGHSANDVIGQVADDGGPHFTAVFADNGPNKRGFSAPVGVAVDAVNHRLFAGDFYGFRILVFNLDIDNHLIDHIPDNVLGEPDFKSRGGSGANGTASIGGLLYDPATERLYASNYSYNRVFVYDLSGGIADNMDADFVLGQPNFDTYDPTTTQSGVSGPSFLALDPTSKHLFVTDSINNRILVFDVDTITNGEPAIYELGQPNDGDPFDSGNAATSQSGMNYPSGIHFDTTTERLFVAEILNNRVLVFDLSGGITNGMNASFELGQTNDGDPFDSAVYGGGQSGISSATGLTLDETGQRLFVTDLNNNRVLVFDIASITNGEDAIFELGQPNDGDPFDSSAAATSQSGISSSDGAFYDPATGYLYVSDDNNNNRVIVFDVASITNGENAVDLLGQLNPDDTPNYTKHKAYNGPNAEGFDSASGVALDTVGHRLFAADFNNNRVLVFNLNTGNTPDDYTADFVIGQPDFNSNAPAGGDPQAYNFDNGPQSVIYDGTNDRLYVNDANGNRILIFDTSSISDGMSASFVLGQPDFTTHDCCAVSSASFVSSEGMALDDFNGRLYVPDGYHNRLLVFDVSTITNGEGAVGVLGQTDFTSDTPGSGAAGMDGTGGAAVDVDNQRVFVADTNNNRILVFDLDDGIDDDITNGEDAVNVLGQDDFSATGSSLSPSGFDNPRALLYEGDGPEPLLYAVDTNHNRVMVFSVSTIDDGQDATDVYGQDDFSSSDCGAGYTGICAPHGLTHNSDTDTLYIADGGNNRILIFGPVPLAGDGEIVGQCVGWPEPYVKIAWSDIAPGAVTQNSNSVIRQVDGQSGEWFFGGPDSIDGTHIDGSPADAGSLPYDYDLRDDSVVLGHTYNYYAKYRPETPTTNTFEVTINADSCGGTAETPGGHLGINSDELTSSAPSEYSDHHIRFITDGAVPNGSRIVITFDPAFDLSALTPTGADVELWFNDEGELVTSDCSGSEPIGADITDNIITLTLCDGDGAQIGQKGRIDIWLDGDNKVLNPPSVGTYGVRLAIYDIDDNLLGEDDPFIAIVNPVDLNAFVAPSFTFTIDGMTGSEAIDDQTVASSSGALYAGFGTLTAGTPVMMGSSLSVSTNAANGFTVTVQENHNMLASSGADIDSFKDGATQYPAATWSAPVGTLGSETTYGHFGITTEDSDTISATASVTSTTDGEWIGLTPGTPRAVWSNSGPADGETQDIGHIDVGYRVQITSLQEAGRYQNRLMYIATPVF